MILVTNDDGIHSPGLNHLAETLAMFDDVFVVAPDRERSNIGMAITIDHPLRATRLGPNRYAVDGTPVDCVDLALGELLPVGPRLVASGINMGQNLGHDVHFSGTVAAARKATFLGVPSIAVSMTRGETWHFETAAAIVERVTKKVLGHRMPAGVLLNVNIPNVPLDEVKGIRLARQDPAPYSTDVLMRYDKFGTPYYWIGGRRLDAPDRHLTDVGLVQANYVTITPLHADMTDEGALKALQSWGLAD